MAFASKLLHTDSRRLRPRRQADVSEVAAPALAPPPWKRHLRFTRQGKYYLGITMGVGFAAINTGNNLLYLLLGMLLALMLVSGILSEMALRDLRISRRLPARAQVGRPHLVEIEVRNDKKRMPSYAIEVEDLRAGHPADKRCFFLKVGPSSFQVAAYRRTPTQRGRDLHTGFRVATRFPFGFFEKSREFQGPGELVVYPAVEPVHVGRERASTFGEGSVASPRGGGDEPLGLRPLREGDDPRDIYWKRRALDGQLLLRERAQAAATETLVLLDNLRASPASGEVDETFEKLVRETASQVVALVRRGDTVKLRSAAGGGAEGGIATGTDPLLRFLALVTTVPPPLASATTQTSRGGPPSSARPGPSEKGEG